MIAVDCAIISDLKSSLDIQKQPSRGVLVKRCSENTQQIYKRTPIPKCDFNKIASNFIESTLRYDCSFVNLLHIFRTIFLKNTSGGLLLDIPMTKWEMCTQFLTKFTNLRILQNHSFLSLLLKNLTSLLLFSISFSKHELQTVTH